MPVPKLLSAKGILLPDGSAASNLGSLGRSKEHSDKPNSRKAAATAKNTAGEAILDSRTRLSAAFAAFVRAWHERCLKNVNSVKQ